MAINELVKLTEHFSLPEVICRQGLQPCKLCWGLPPPLLFWPRMMEHLNVLEIVRFHIQEAENAPIIILLTSAFRCKDHNREVSTCQNPDNSQHLRFATDLQVIKKTNPPTAISSIQIYDLINRLISPSSGGLGIINDKTLHFDLRPDSPWREPKPYGIR